MDEWQLEQERQDRRVGRICAVIANVNRDPKRRTKAYSEEDFMPRVTSKVQTVEEQVALLSKIGVKK